MTTLESKVLSAFRTMSDALGNVSALHDDVAAKFGVHPMAVHEAAIHLYEAGYISGKPYIDSERFSGRVRPAT